MTANTAIFLVEIRDCLLRALDREGCKAPPECTAVVAAINQLMTIGDSRVNVEAIVKELPKTASKRLT